MKNKFFKLKMSWKNMADAFLCVEVPFTHPFVTYFNLQTNWTNWSVSESINLVYSLILRKHTDDISH